MPTLAKSLIVAGLLSGAASFAAYQTGFHWLRPAFFDETGRVVHHNAYSMDRCGKARITSQFGDPAGVSDWQRCETAMEAVGTMGSFKARHNIVTGLGFIAATSLLAGLGRSLTGRPPPKVIRGRKLFTGKQALKELAEVSRRECARSGEGLHLPPGIPMSRDRESRHVLITGSTGAGKTTVMQHLILQAMARRDKIMVLDVKGDMTSKLPMMGNIIAPHDARSLAWDIAADVQTKQEARELAARLIPESRSDRFWSDAAREIFVACLSLMQATKRTEWGWDDLRSLVIADIDVLLDAARRCHPEAAAFLSDPTSKTNQSILATFRAHMNIVSVLADAWPESHRNRSFSVKRWLSLPVYNPVVLQHDGRYPQLSNAWLSGIIGLIASQAASPAMKENPGSRTWLFLDEFPQLERLPHFSTLLDVGRSKGISVVLGAQDISQIRSAYGADQADAWMSMTGTHVITRLNLGQSAETTSRFIGKQTVESWRKSDTRSGGRTSTTWAPVREDRPVITPSELSDRLGPFDDGVRVLILGPGEHAYEVTVPFVHLSEKRPASVLADWTSKPAWEIAPLPETRTPQPSQPVLAPDVAESIRARKPAREFDA